MTDLVPYADCWLISEPDAYAHAFAAYVMTGRVQYLVDARGEPVDAIGPDALHAAA